METVSAAADIEFYNMKLKRKVSVPETQLRKQVFAKPGAAGGSQRRYALVAGHEGTRMFKFVNEATHKSLNVPEVTSRRGRTAPTGDGDHLRLNERSRGWCRRLHPRASRVAPCAPAFLDAVAPHAP
jgi:hypothetical protein